MIEIRQSPAKTAVDLAKHAGASILTIKYSKGSANARPNQM
jgi:hypothetical protein